MAVPVPSWEAVQERGVPIRPSATMKSVWQRDATATFTRISCGAREVGVGTEWILWGALNWW